MKEKVIGVPGGMGSEATRNFFQEIIANKPAGTDQEHLRVIIDSNPKIPDRTNAIFRGGESPVAASCEGIKRTGADFIVIPCITAHLFPEELRRKITLPVISIFDATADHIAAHYPMIGKIGLPATTSTIEGSLLQERLSRSGSIA